MTMSLPIVGVLENGRAVFGSGTTAMREPVSSARLALHREQERRDKPMTLTRAEKSALDAQLEENCEIADGGGDLRWALAHSDYHPWVLAVGLELIGQVEGWDPDIDSSDEPPPFSERLEEAKARVEPVCPLEITDWRGRRRRADFASF